MTETGITHRMLEGLHVAGLRWFAATLGHRLFPPGLAIKPPVIAAVAGGKGMAIEGPRRATASYFDFGASRTNRPRRVFLIGGISILVLLLFISRRPDQSFTPQLLATDGTEFFSKAETTGLNSLVEPYAGYFHLVPRSIAWLCTIIPWTYVPAAYVWCAAIVATFVVARVAFSRLPLAPRVMGAFAMVGLPHSGEVFLNVTNINWILAGLLVVNFLEGPPVSRFEAYRRSIELLVAGLSGVMVVFVAPFALLWSWHFRYDRLSRPLTGAWLIAALVQAAALAASSRRPAETTISVTGVLRWVVPKYANAIFVGHWLPHSMLLGGIIAGVSSVAVIVLLFDRSNSYRVRAGLMLLAAAIFLTAGREANQGWPNPLGAGARYTYIPLVLILWAFAWLWAGTKRRLHRTIALVLYALPLVASVSAWTAPTLPRLDWERQVREARNGTRHQFEIPFDCSFPVPHLDTSSGKEIPPRS